MRLLCNPKLMSDLATFNRLEVSGPRVVYYGNFLFSLNAVCDCCARGKPLCHFFLSNPSLHLMTSLFIATVCSKPLWRSSHVFRVSARVHFAVSANGSFADPLDSTAPPVSPSCVLMPYLPHSMFMARVCAGWRSRRAVTHPSLFALSPVKQPGLLASLYILSSGVASAVCIYGPGLVSRAGSPLFVCVRVIPSFL